MCLCFWQSCSSSKPHTLKVAGVSTGARLALLVEGNSRQPPSLHQNHSAKALLVAACCNNTALQPSRTLSSLRWFVHALHPGSHSKSTCKSEINNAGSRVEPGFHDISPIVQGLSDGLASPPKIPIQPPASSPLPCWQLPRTHPSPSSCLPHMHNNTSAATTDQAAFSSSSLHPLPAKKRIVCHDSAFNVRAAPNHRACVELPSSGAVQQHTAAMQPFTTRHQSHNSPATLRDAATMQEHTGDDVQAESATDLHITCIPDFTAQAAAPLKQQRSHWLWPSAQSVTQHSPPPSPHSESTPERTHSQVCGDFGSRCRRVFKYSKSASCRSEQQLPSQDNTNRSLSLHKISCSGRRTAGSPSISPRACEARTPFSSVSPQQHTTAAIPFARVSSNLIFHSYTNPPHTTSASVCHVPFVVPGSALNLPPHSGSNASAPLSRVSEASLIDDLLNRNSVLDTHTRRLVMSRVLTSGSGEQVDELVAGLVRGAGPPRPDSCPLLGEGSCTHGRNWQDPLGASERGPSTNGTPAKPTWCNPLPEINPSFVVNETSETLFQHVLSSNRSMYNGKPPSPCGRGASVTTCNGIKFTASDVQVQGLSLQDLLASRQSRINSATATTVHHSTSSIPSHHSHLSPTPSVRRKLVRSSMSCSSGMTRTQALQDSSVIVVGDTPLRAAQITSWDKQGSLSHTCISDAAEVHEEGSNTDVNSATTAATSVLPSPSYTSSAAMLRSGACHAECTAYQGQTQPTTSSPLPFYNTVPTSVLSYAAMAMSLDSMTSSDLGSNTMATNFDAEDMFSEPQFLYGGFGILGSD